MCGGRKKIALQPRTRERACGGWWRSSISQMIGRQPLDGALRRPVRLREKKNNKFRSTQSMDPTARNNHYTNERGARNENWTRILLLFKNIWKVKRRETMFKLTTHPFRRKLPAAGPSITRVECSYITLKWVDEESKWPIHQRLRLAASRWNTCSSVTSHLNGKQQHDNWTRGNRMNGGLILDRPPCLSS